MKKAILILVTFASFSCAYAQKADHGFSTGAESDKVMNLSADQIAKIKELNREVGPKFRAIGQSSLSGYEKGQRKRALALEHKAAIRDILTPEQIDAWESHYGSMDSGEGLRDIIKDEYDMRLDRLERDYERQKEALEDGPLPKYEKKAALDDLKKTYKADKESLKAQRDAAVENGVLEE